MCGILNIVLHYKNAVNDDIQSLHQLCLQMLCLRGISAIFYSIGTQPPPTSTNCRQNCVWRHLTLSGQLLMCRNPLGSHGFPYLHPAMFRPGTSSGVPVAASFRQLPPTVSSLHQMPPTVALS